MTICIDDIDRKIKCFKKQLQNSGYYNTKVVVRTKTFTAGTDDVFKSDYTNNTITDKVVDCIVEYGPEIHTYDNYVETIDGDIRLSTLIENESCLDDANEIWIGVKFNSNNKIVYDSDNVTFTQGTMYKIKSTKKSMFEEEMIYILKTGGKLS